jgi:cobalt ECF transporter T component CbiQ
VRPGFVERTITTFLAAAEYTAGAEAMATSKGALQSVDPRVKVAGLLGPIVAAALSRRLDTIAWLFAIAVVLALASKVSLARLLRWIWWPALLFTGAIALPAVFLTPGAPAFSLGSLTATHQGIRSALFLVARAETAVTYSALLAFTTPWPWAMKALRTLGCPAALVAILGMTFRYIFVILGTAAEMFESRQSRTVGRLEGPERRRMATTAAGALMEKSLQLSGEVYLAMQSRGYRGEVHILHDFRMNPADWFWLAGFASLTGMAIWGGRG